MVAIVTERTTTREFSRSLGPTKDTRPARGRQRRPRALDGFREAIEPEATPRWLSLALSMAHGAPTTGKGGHIMGPKDRAAHGNNTNHPGYDKSVGYVPDTYENRVDPNQSKEDFESEKTDEYNDAMDRAG